MITFQVDELVPCLKEVETGDIYETEVVRIKRKSILAKYNKKTGWYVNWAEFDSSIEIYALVIKGTYDVQGLVAIEYDSEAKAVHLVWGCVSPENNVWQYGKRKFTGIGGHLIAIAAELSFLKGYEGFLYGEAMDEELFNYYCDNFGAMYLPSIDGHIYRFMLSDESTNKIREVYSYEWTDEII